MIPLALDPQCVSFALVGRGEALARRLRGLREGGAEGVATYCDLPGTELIELADTGLRRFLPGVADLAGVQVVWIAGLPRELGREMAGHARAAGALVNVEDDSAACDFHNVAQVRRGDLLLTVSTGGKSPRLAARIRQSLENQYGPEWAEKLESLGADRAGWQSEARPAAEMADLTDVVIDAGDWL